MAEPIYTAHNCTPAYQLRWSLALFANKPLPSEDHWISQLKADVEIDGVRILEQTFKAPNVWQFLLSTQPHVAPPSMVKAVKGRWQRLIRPTHRQAFRRNFDLTSLDDAKSKVVENYVQSQIGRHPMADSQVQQRIAQFQLQRPEQDVTAPQFSAHGRYIYALHVVLVHEQRWSAVSERQWATTRDMISKASLKKNYRLSRAAIVADHIHLTLASPYDQSPEEVALMYLNNLAYAHGMKPIYRFGYYVGTIGPYDMGAIWRRR